MSGPGSVETGTPVHSEAMCLGVPGQITEILPDPLGMTMGKVSFGGVQREVCLAYVPKAEVGDWVLVHVGFALNTLDEQEAKEIFEALAELEAGDPEGPPGATLPDRAEDA